MVCETLQLDKVSHFFFSPSLLLLCLCFLEAKIDKPGGAVLCVFVCVCGSCQSCQLDWSCSGRQPSVEQQPLTPYNKHTHLYTQNICSAHHSKTIIMMQAISYWSTIDTPCFKLLEHPEEATGLLRAAYFIFVSSFQYLPCPLITTTPNVT